MVDPVIRVAIVDDHPAVRIGLNAALRGEPDIEPVGSAGGAGELEPLLHRTRPDVVLLDYHLPGTDGLSICREIKSQELAPAVLIYSAFADDSLVVPAIVAGADGVVHKSAPPRELYEHLRAVARGEAALPPVSAAALRAAGDALDPEDLPVLGMLAERIAPAAIAGALRIDRSELTRRLDRMLARIKVPVPAQAERYRADARR
jgi:DNA-binding NarL/FixJ family response regulator